DARPGNDFLAQVCVDWEAQARRAADLGMRVVHVRTGMVLDRRGGALARMLTPFKLGLGGPIAGGRQFISWIHHEDLVATILTAGARAMPAKALVLGFRFRHPQLEQALRSALADG